MSKKVKLALFPGLTLVMIITLFFSKKEIFFIKDEYIKDSKLNYKDYIPNPSDLVISRSDYANKLYGFWLGQCIANWTGLITEMDKIGNVGEIKTGKFYTREDWGKPDQPNIWSNGKSSSLSPIIDFVFIDKGNTWGSDDDTDIEYMYQYMHYVNESSTLNGEQIRRGWLKHIKEEEENFLWVSNQAAFDLMHDGMIPPATSSPENNPYYEMIDAQLTTEIFGFFAPARPDIALKLSHLPIRTTAKFNSEWIAEFYVIMYSLASYVDEDLNLKDKILWMATQARKRLPDDSYSAKMYDYVKTNYEANVPWEKTRDLVYNRYQILQEDGYDLTSKNLHCNGCFASGINFASSIISLFYGAGDIQKTIKIGTLCGWDSDNPTSTWGGLIGFMIGKDGIEKSFGREFGESYNIHRTRINFPNEGLDTFSNMAKIGVYVIDRIVQEQIGGGIDLENNLWYIPDTDIKIIPGSQH